jgi:flagellar basal-body rod modification protein FlgD
MTMVGTPIGTKNYVDARPETAVQSKDTGERNLSANDLKMLGEDNVGDLLNKAVDPNWIDPSKKVRTVGSDKMGKDAFMKLMLAQMKNQDPTNPLKSHEMAAQLAQFSSLEQMQNMNTTLEDIKAGQKPAETYQALNFIGKAVSGDSAKVSRMKGDTNHEFIFNLPEDAKEVNIQVKNELGEVVRKFSIKDQKKGENSFTWNGKDERDLNANVGEYTFSIEAKSSIGAKINVKTDFDGVITGVNYTPEGPVLLVGNQTVKLKDVKKIVDPVMRAANMPARNPVNAAKVGQENPGQNLQNRADAELQNGAVPGQTKDVRENGGNASEQGAQEGYNGKPLPGVAMQREFLNKIEKETK